MKERWVYIILITFIQILSTEFVPFWNLLGRSNRLFLILHIAVNITAKVLLTWKVPGHQHRCEDSSLKRHKNQHYNDLCNTDSVCVCDSVHTHFKFPPGVELAQAFHSLLTVHHGGHSGALLHVEENKQHINIRYFSVTVNHVSAEGITLQRVTDNTQQGALKYKNNKQSQHNQTKQLNPLLHFNTMLM